MGFKMRVIEDSIDFQTLINAADEAAESTMQKCASVIKEKTENKLRGLQKTNVNQNGTEIRRPRKIHMADDVVIKTGKDKYGHRYAKVGGGKKTGTLWHIVNDGTYKNNAAHFMDNVISEVNGEIELILDQELRRALNDK